MSLTVLQEKLSMFPEDCFDEINTFFDFLSYKVKFSTNHSSQTLKPIIPGLAQGKWKYPKDINAFDDEVISLFGE